MLWRFALCLLNMGFGDFVGPGLIGYERLLGRVCRRGVRCLEWWCCFGGLAKWRAGDKWIC